MKFVIQRVKNAEVRILDSTPIKVSTIQGGFLVLIGISQEDVEEFFDNGNPETVNKMIHKLVNMRIFQDENGKTNLNLDAVSGELLLVSQFTLYADCKHGNRPSFTSSGEPKRAQELYQYIVRECEKLLDGSARVKTGEFGAHMEVSLVNDGPFTIVLDSKEIM